MQSDNAQAILLFGDLAYADDYNGHSTGQRNGYQPRWDTWGQMMQPIISHLPFLSLMGRLPFAVAFLPCTMCLLPCVSALVFHLLDVVFYLQCEASLVFACETYSRMCCWGSNAELYT